MKTRTVSTSEPSRLGSFAIMSTKPDVAWTMAAILGTMLAFVAGAALIHYQTLNTSPSSDPSATRWLPCPKTEPSKRAYELFVAAYTPIWMLTFAWIIAFQLYEQFTAWNYLQVCGGLAAPLLLQPFFLPWAGFRFPDAQRPLWERYALKANLWLAVYSFIGNYWYTHYFYSVLGAKYTMPSHRLNNVPLAMFFATHFYFSSYHLFSNIILRKVVTTYQPGPLRRLLFVSIVVVFSYVIAFMETFTISSYPYYSFQDRYLAYTVGSAFYGIYFLVSFPGFFYLDGEVDVAGGKKVTAWDTFVSSCGHGMMTLTLLDLVRLYLDIPLVVGRDPLTFMTSTTKK